MTRFSFTYPPLTLAVFLSSISVLGLGADENNDSTLDVIPKYEMKVSGVLNVEGAYLSGAYNNQTSELKYQLRKAKLEVEQTFFDNFTSKIEVAIDGEYQFSLSELSFNYQLFDEYTLSAGLLKNSVGLQNSTSSKKIKTMERSLVSDALIEDIGLALTLDFNIDDTYLFTSVFQSTENNEANALGYSTRIAQEIKLRDQQLQFGINADFRNYNNYVYQLNKKAELNLAKKNIDSDAVLLNSTRLISLDAALIHNKLTLQTELMSKSLDVNTLNFGTAQHTYEGFYVQGSYLFTGSAVKFKNGNYSKMKLAEKGAFEIVSRYSLLNIKATTNATFSNALVGLNYYVNSNFKVMSQVSVLNDADESSMALGVSAQTVF